MMTAELPPGISGVTSEPESELMGIIPFESGSNSLESFQRMIDRPPTQEPEVCLADSELQDAMSCPVCYRIFDEPMQLQCGHSICSFCLSNLRVRVEESNEECYTCPMCRHLSYEEPSVNYSLKGLIGRLKEKEARVEKCCECSRTVNANDQYSCDECDDNDKQLKLRCTLCAMNKHSKFGHQISSYGDREKRLKEIVRDLQSFADEAKNCLDSAKNVNYFNSQGNLKVICDLIELLDENHSLFKTIEVALTGERYMSRKEIEAHVSNAYRLRYIYNHTLHQYAQLFKDLSFRLKALFDSTKSELDTLSRGSKMIIKYESERSTLFHPQISWFEYQRPARVNLLHSIEARRNAAIQRRSLKPMSVEDINETINAINLGLQQINAGTWSVFSAQGNAAFPYGAPSNPHGAPAFPQGTPAFPHGTPAFPHGPATYAHEATAYPALSVMPHEQPTDAMPVSPRTQPSPAVELSAHPATSS